MSKTMSAFRFYFRNGETWTIKKETIGDLWIKHISTSFGRIGDGDFEKINPCEAFRIELLPEADRVQSADINSGGLEGGMFSRATQYEDIEKMEIIFDNQEKDLIYFPYEDKGTPGQEGLDNKYQSTKIGKEGQLFIVIDPANTVESLYSEKI